MWAKPRKDDARNVCQCKELFKGVATKILSLLGIMVLSHRCQYIRSNRPYVGLLSRYTFVVAQTLSKGSSIAKANLCFRQRGYYRVIAVGETIICVEVPVSSWLIVSHSRETNWLIMSIRDPLMSDSGHSQKLRLASSW